MVCDTTPVSTTTTSTTDESLSLENMEFMLNADCCTYMHDPDDVLSKGISKKIVKYAKSKMTDLKACPSIAKLQVRQVPEIEHSEIQLSQLLGEGSFARVFEISKTTSPSINPSKHVVKMLRPKLLNQPKMFASCVGDIAKETILLSRLESHPNICQLQAIAKSGIEAFASGRHDAYFIVLDRVESTLADLIKSWKQELLFRHLRKKSAASLPAATAPSSSSANPAKWFKKMSLFKSNQYDHHFPDKFTLKHDTPAEFLKRLELGVQLASAVKHLHDHNILHRDLKPDNVGVDVNGQIKLFDFDVARVLPSASHTSTFKLTKAVGTKRYMAPETGLGLSYNISADVYSFSLVLYYLLSLERPFDDLTVEVLPEMVYLAGHRPTISKKWSKSLRHLIESGWSARMSKRPIMAVMRDELTQIAVTMQQDQDQGQPSSSPSSLSSSNKKSSSSSSTRKNKNKKSFSILSWARTGPPKKCKSIFNKKPLSLVSATEHSDSPLSNNSLKPIDCQ